MLLKTDAIFTDSGPLSPATFLQQRLQSVVTTHTAVARQVNVLLRVAGQEEYDPLPANRILGAATEVVGAVQATAIHAQQLLIGGADVVAQALTESGLGNLLGSATTSSEETATLSRVTAAPTHQDLQASLAPQLTEGGFQNLDPSAAQDAEQAPMHDVSLIQETLPDVIEQMSWEEASYDDDDVQQMMVDVDDLILQMYRSSQSLLPNSCATLFGNINLKLKIPAEWAGHLLPPTG